MGKTYVEDTGIFRREWTKLETGHEVFEAHRNAIPLWFDAEKELSKIEKCLRSVIAPHLVTPKGETRGGRLAKDAPPAAKDAHHALIELSVLRQGIEMLQPAGRDKQFGRMLIAALNVGFTYCQVQVRPFEPTVVKGAKAADDLMKASQKKATNTATRKQNTTDAALTVWSENTAKSLVWVQGILASQKRNPKTKQVVELSDSERKLSDGIRDRFSTVVTRRGVERRKCLLGRISTIETHTAGLKRPPTSPKLG